MRLQCCYFLAFFAIVLFSKTSAQQTVKVTPSGIGYLEYLPQGYNSNSNKYPVVISLHGVKEKGTTSTDPATVKAGVPIVANVGLPKYVKNGTQYPFILISPQLKSNYGSWPPDYIVSVLNYVKTYLRVDERRVYLTGLSLGGGGVWTTAAAYPNVFAAIAPVCASTNAASKACALASSNVATWAFHGDADAVVSYTVTTKMVSAINVCIPQCNPLAKVTIYPGMSHIIWDKAYKESNVLNWMLGYVNGTVPTSANALPSCSAGGDKTITLPTNSVTIQGSASDSDGSIASFQWSKVSGGAATLSGAGTSKLVASNLVAGSYVFRLTVKDNKGATKYDDMTVTVKSTTNIAPVAIAGLDLIVHLPTTSVSVYGSGTDKDGTIAAYAWTKLSGAACTLSSATSKTLKVSGLKAGKYIFQLTVKDNKGAIGTDKMLIVVK